MNPGSTSSPKRFSRRLANIVAVVDRFHKEAEMKGDVIFADALRACALNMSGGDLNCPVGRLVFEETLRTGKFMAGDLTPQTPAPPPAAPAKSGQAPHPSAGTFPPATTEWSTTFFKLWSILKEDAKQNGDKECLEALQESEELTPQHQCPIRVLLAQHLPSGKKP